MQVNNFFDRLYAHLKMIKPNKINEALKYHNIEMPHIMYYNNKRAILKNKTIIENPNMDDLNMITVKEVFVGNTSFYVYNDILFITHKMLLFKMSSDMDEFNISNILKMPSLGINVESLFVDIRDFANLIDRMRLHPYLVVVEDLNEYIKDKLEKLKEYKGKFDHSKNYKIDYCSKLISYGNEEETTLRVVFDNKFTDFIISEDKVKMSVNKITRNKSSDVLAFYDNALICNTSYNNLNSSLDYMMDCMSRITKYYYKNIKDKEN